MLLTLALAACDTFDVEVDRPKDSAVAEEFSFSGEIEFVRDGLSAWDTITLTVTSGPSMQGTFFRDSDGAVGTLSGSMMGTSGSFSGTIGGFCPGNIDEGTIRAVGSDLVEVEMRGSDCEGAFTARAMLGQVACTDVSGDFLAEESFTVTCTVGGQSETVSATGSGALTLVQSGCDVSFTVPGVGATRQGTISARTLFMSGPFVVPVGNQVSISENHFDATIDVSNKYEFGFQGTGLASGTVDGQPFTCVGTSTGKLTREFQVAVGLLRGGPISSSSGSSSSAVWKRLRDQVLAEDSSRVLVHDFLAHPGQIWVVESWLNTVTNNGAKPMQILLVGHSAGGNALVLAGSQPNDFRYVTLDSRITVDPYDPYHLPLLASERYLQYTIARKEGRFVNYRAAMEGGCRWGPHLWGYSVLGTTVPEEDIPSSNHCDVIDRVQQLGYVGVEVRRLLGTAQAAPSYSPPETTAVSVGDVRFDVLLGWRRDVLDSRR